MSIIAVYNSSYSSEDAERAIKELKHIGGRQVSVSMATKRHRKRKRGKSANAEEDQGENSLHGDKEDGSIDGEDNIEDGSNPGKHIESCHAKTSIHSFQHFIERVSTKLLSVCWVHISR